MPEYDNSIADVLKRALQDAQDLVRGEVALAKAEMREEMRRLGAGMAALAVAAVAALVAIVFLLAAAAWALAAILSWPVWAGYAIVGAVVLLIAIVVGLMGRSRLAAQPHMPRTVETMKENMEWMRARTP